MPDSIDLLEPRLHFITRSLVLISLSYNQWVFPVKELMWTHNLLLSQLYR
jgi:hypothetical protein